MNYTTQHFTQTSKDIINRQKTLHIRYHLAHSKTFFSLFNPTGFFKIIAEDIICQVSGIEPSKHTPQQI